MPAVLTDQWDFFLFLFILVK
jgi:hypothetical protein